VNFIHTGSTILLPTLHVYEEFQYINFKSEKTMESELDSFYNMYKKNLRRLKIYSTSKVLKSVINKY